VVAALQPHFNLEVTGDGVDHLPSVGGVLRHAEHVVARLVYLGMQSML
jgi:hypothetical protein